MNRFENSVNAFWLTDQVWDVFNVTGSKDDVFVSFEMFNASDLATEVDYTPYGSFSYSCASNDGQLVWSAIPEPSSLLIGLLMGTAFLRRRRVDGASPNAGNIQ